MTPSGFTLNTSEGDVNVTLNSSIYTPSVGYTFTSNGTRGFMTATLEKVKLVIPYRLNLVDASHRDATHVFIRIYNYEDSSVVDINGSVSTGGTITAYIPGLPLQFFAAAVYNANMDAVASVTPSADIVADEAVEDVVEDVDVTKTAATSWNGQRWCTIYNASSSRLITAVKAVLGITTTPTLTEIKNTVKTYVSNGASTAQYYLQRDGFSAPLVQEMTTSSDPCGSELGTAGRYPLYLNDPGSAFSSYSPDEVISESANKYARVYVNPSRISDTSLSSKGSVKAAISHNIFDAIMNYYELYDGYTTHGLREALATLYGATIDNSGTITVRSYTESDTFHLSDFIDVNNRGDDPDVAPSTQDFYAYIGKKYNSSSLNYLSTLVDKTYAAVQNASSTESLRTQPARSTILDGLNNGLAITFDKTLSNTYLDFLLQRLFEHNSESQFGRTGETTSGFASNLMSTDPGNDAYNSIASVTIDPTACTVTQGEGFGNIAAYAARVIKITPTTTKAGGVTITVALTPSYGAIGQNWHGYSYYQSTATAVSTTPISFSSFGVNATDEIDIAMAFQGTDRVANLRYTVTCQ